MDADILLIAVVGAALLFDFTNGFHDTANAMATPIATRALKPQVAVAPRRRPRTSSVPSSRPRSRDHLARHHPTRT